MLRSLRNKKTAKKIWIILAAIIVPAFALWGSGSLIRSKEEAAYLGRIFGKKISALEYKDALEAVKNQAILQFGDKLSEIKNQLNLESQAWERLLLLAEAKKRGIKTNDAEVIELLKIYPIFHKKGSFDNSMYLYMVRYVFHTQPRVFEEQTRQNLILSKLYNALTGSVSLNDEEIKEAYRKENEQISIYYIAALYSDFTKGIVPSEEEIKDYFSGNSLEFKQPLSFNIEYVSLAKDDKDEKTAAEKIDNLTLRLNKGEDFSRTAKEFGLQVKESGLFAQNEPIPGIGWSPEILNLISKTQAGQFIFPAPVDKNYYILRVKEKKDPYVPELEKIKDKVRAGLIKRKSQEIAKTKIEECLKQLRQGYKPPPLKKSKTAKREKKISKTSGGSKEKTPETTVDFDNAAAALGLKSSSTGLFKYNSYIENVGASDTFWTNAANLKENRISEIIGLPSGFYIIKLKSRVPVDEEKFNKEKIELSQKLLLQKKQEYFIKFLGELKKNRFSS